jgi:excisionase family DNA binding protein
MPIELFELLEAVKAANQTESVEVHQSPSECLLLRPEEAARSLGVGRTTVYELMRTGQIPSVQIGASRRIPADDLAHYVEGLRAGRRSAS